MKTVTLLPKFVIPFFLLFVLPAATVLAQDYSYYYNGEKISFTPSPMRMAVRYKSEAAMETKRSTLTQQNTQLQRPDGAPKGLGVLIAAERLNRDDIEKKLNTLKRDNNVVYATPFLVDANGNEVGAPTDEFIVKLKDFQAPTVLRALAARYDIRSIRPYALAPSIFILSIDRTNSHNTLELSRIFFESGIAVFAEPNLLTLNSLGTNDPLYSSQYALHNTGQNGGLADSDMDMPEAWGITTGCTVVRIAILDNGVQLSHPDLDGNLDTGFDATGGGGNGAATGSDSHGTGCAGIAAAEGGNQLGIAGVAYRCRIVPVRVMLGNSGTHEWLASGIDWAWQNNRADVISMSLGSFGGSQLVENAVHNAVTNGRNGAGCILLAITHNDALSSIRFPASLPEVIAVGATNNRDERPSFSNFGTGTDIVAPGVDIRTTTLNSGYVSNFTGTSASCPNAAGVAALILSVNPTLTQAQARQILETTTDKLPGFAFTANVPGQPNGTWNNEVGYGRVNAHRAVVLAAGGTIGGATLLCSGSIDQFPLSNPPANLNLTWTATPSNLVSTSSGTGSTAAFTASSWESGRITLTYSATTVCGTLSRSKRVSIGTPVITDMYGYSYAGYGPFPILPYYSVVNNPVYYTPSTIVADFSFASDASSYNFHMIDQSDNDIVLGGGLGPEGVSFNLEFTDYTKWAVVRVTGTNACGTEYFDAGFYAYQQDGLYAVGPNPADQELVITFASSRPETVTPPAKATGRTEPFTVTLLDGNGTAVRTATDAAGRSALLDTQQLATGIYYLHITQGKNVIRKHVVIKH